jgi:D-alanine-D-alanine ligase
MNTIVLSSVSDEGEEDDEGDLPVQFNPANPADILIIFNHIQNLNYGESRDLLADQETGKTARSIREAVQRIGIPCRAEAIHTDIQLRSVMSGIDREKTLVFNLCESLAGDSQEEAFVAGILEEYQVSYVGATPRNLSLCLNKDAAKSCLLSHGLPTPRYQVFRTGDELVKVPLPAIVKPVAEDGSLGITANSVVDSDEGLRKRVKYVLDKYCQPALAEEFLTGREFSVSLYGNHFPKILSISEYDYSHNRKYRPPILSFTEKWSTDHFPTMDPAPIDAGRRERASRIALSAFRNLECRDYARIDIREKNGQMYILDINPNPCLAEDGGFARAARTAGYDYPHLIHLLINQAWQRAMVPQETFYAIPNIQCQNNPAR